jgi:hypothetical protein
MGQNRTKQHAPRVKRKRAANIPGHLSEFETAEEFGVAIRTLRKWRQLRVGPPWIAVGRRIFYSDASRCAWLQAREIQPIREAA